VAHELHELSMLLKDLQGFGNLAGQRPHLQGFQNLVGVILSDLNLNAQTEATRFLKHDRYNELEVTQRIGLLLIRKIRAICCQAVYFNPPIFQR